MIIITFTPLSKININAIDIAIEDTSSDKTWSETVKLDDMGCQMNSIAREALSTYNFWRELKQFVERAPKPVLSCNNWSLLHSYYEMYCKDTLRDDDWPFRNGEKKYSPVESHNHEVRIEGLMKWIEEAHDMIRLLRIKAACREDAERECETLRGNLQKICNRAWSGHSCVKCGLPTAETEYVVGFGMCDRCTIGEMVAASEATALEDCACLRERVKDLERALGAAG